MCSGSNWAAMGKKNNPVVILRNILTGWLGENGLFLDSGQEGFPGLLDMGAIMRGDESNQFLEVGRAKNGMAGELPPGIFFEGR